ncbi:MAG: 30S ribosomal protein S3 [Deltaproteobacteria bacterium]|nr:30S ribosomal protein S3 [Deltaproteobacteria bacterium]
MGQKTHPNGLRLGIIRDWNSRWYADKGYAKLLHEDLRIRAYLKDKLASASVSRIEIERAHNKLTIVIHTARPGVIIGRKGQELETLQKKLRHMADRDIFIKVQEVRRADLDAQLVAENIGNQLQRRIAFRRAMKRAVTNAMKLGAKGVRVACSGRLGGAEMSRFEQYREGSVPLHTLKADINYGQYHARTTYGVIGVKVWIYHGEADLR